MLADNTSHLRDATTRRQQATQRRATEALAELPPNATITVAGLARTARVARSWLYTQPDLLNRLAQHNAAAGPAALTAPASEGSWRRRCEAANGRLRELTAENSRLRTALEHAHGALRAQHDTASGDPPTVPQP